MLYCHPVVQHRQASASPPVPKSGYVQSAHYNVVQVIHTLSFTQDILEVHSTRGKSPLPDGSPSSNKATENFTDLVVSYISPPLETDQYNQCFTARQ
jgi:hypothetical protein